MRLKLTPLLAWLAAAASTSPNLAHAAGSIYCGDLFSTEALTLSASVSRHAELGTHRYPNAVKAQLQNLDFAQVSIGRRFFWNDALYEIDAVRDAGEGFTQIHAFLSSEAPDHAKMPGSVHLLFAKADPGTVSVTEMLQNGQQPGHTYQNSVSQISRGYLSMPIHQASRNSGPVRHRELYALEPSTAKVGQRFRWSNIEYQITQSQFSGDANKDLQLTAKSHVPGSPVLKIKISSPRERTVRLIHTIDGWRTIFALEDSAI